MTFEEVCHGLLAAEDAIVEDAITHADPMVLRGLLHQLTGDPEAPAGKARPA